MTPRCLTWVTEDMVVLTEERSKLRNKVLTAVLDTLHLISYV